MGGAGRALACGDLIAEANPTFLSAESDFLMGLGELIFLAGGGTAGAFVCFLPMFRVLATSKQDSVWVYFRRGGCGCLPSGCFKGDCRA